MHLDSIRNIAVIFFFAILSQIAVGEDKRVVGYVQMGADIQRLEDAGVFQKLTHLNLAFANPIDDDGNFTASKRLKTWVASAKKYELKVLVSIGGGSASENRETRDRYFRLIQDKRRDRFVDQLIEFTVENGLDGLDVDLEGPAINSDYEPFIRDLAAKCQPKSLLLTSALSKGYGGKQVTDAALSCFDFINVMAYDATGSWAPDRPGPHSSYMFAVENVQYWIDRGVPKSKIVLGVPFYGHGFGKDKGSHTYRSIVKNHPQAPHVDVVGDVIHYNGMNTIRKKVDFVKVEELGGIMIWEISQDTSDGTSLLSVIDSTLHPK